MTVRSKIASERRQSSKHAKTHDLEQGKKEFNSLIQSSEFRADPIGFVHHSLIQNDLPNGKLNANQYKSLLKTFHGTMNAEKEQKFQAQFSNLMRRKAVVHGDEDISNAMTGLALDSETRPKRIGLKRKTNLHNDDIMVTTKKLKQMTVSDSQSRRRHMKNVSNKIEKRLERRRQRNRIKNAGVVSIGDKLGNFSFS